MIDGAHRRNPAAIRLPPGPRMAAVLLILLCGARPASSADRIRFLKSTDLAGLGLRVKLMSPCTAQPLPPPTTFSYTIQSGAETQQAEFYDPAELWIRTQHQGRWTDDDGNTVTLAAMTRPLPRGFPRQHVSHAEYDDAIKALPTPAWDAATLAAWVGDFTGAANVKPTVLRRPSFQVKALYRFAFDGAPRRLAYAALPAHRNPDAEQRANPWVFIQVDLAPDADLPKSLSAVEQDFIGTLTTAVATTRTSARGDSMQADGHGGNASEAFQRSRASIAQSIGNMRDWWYAETANYILLSNLTTQHRPMVQALQDNIELLRERFAAFVPPADPIDSVSVIRIFATQDEYVRYVGSDFAWTGGLWVPSKKELVIRPTETGSTRDQREQFLRVSYHEAFHQYLFFALGKRPVPAWYNEGMAEMFEQAEIRGKSVALPEHEASVARVTDMIGRHDVPFAALLELSYPGFYDPDATRRADNYALAWALVYYLHRGAAQERPARYHTIPGKLRAAIVAGASERDASRAAFAEVDMARFQEQFADFWTSRSRRGAARKNL